MGVYPGRPGQDVCKGLGLRGAFCMPHAVSACTTYRSDAVSTDTVLSVGCQDKATAETVRFVDVVPGVFCPAWTPFPFSFEDGEICAKEEAWWAN
jgi:hypothetical protein